MSARDVPLNASHMEENLRFRSKMNQRLLGLGVCSQCGERFFGHDDFCTKHKYRVDCLVAAEESDLCFCPPCVHDRIARNIEAAMLTAGSDRLERYWAERLRRHLVTP